MQVRGRIRTGESRKADNNPKKRNRLIERELFTISLLVFGASMSTLISRQDSIHYALTWSLASTRSIFLNGAVYNGQPDVVLLGGHNLAALPPGLAFFSFPIVALAQVILPLDPTTVGIFIATYLSCVFGALATIVFFKTSRMFAGEKSSAILTVVFAFGTSLWLYSRIFLPEALATCLSLASVYCVLKLSEERVLEGELITRRARETAGLGFISGLLLGLAVFVDNMVIFFFIPVFLYLVLRVRSPARGIKALSVPTFILGGLIGLAPMGYYDFITTGNALATPYGNLLIGGVQSAAYTFHFLNGVYAELISPTSGILFFTPFVLISVIGSFYFMKEKLGQFLLFSGLFLSVLIPISLQSQSSYPHNTVGPSELILAVPYILLPALGAMNKFKIRSFVGTVIYCLAAISVLITGIIALTEPTPNTATLNLVAQAGGSTFLGIDIPLFMSGSYLTWWSFFAHPLLYAMLILIFPLVALVIYSTRGEFYIRKRPGTEVPSPAIFEAPPIIKESKVSDDHLFFYHPRSLRKLFVKKLFKRFGD